jgi:hypothetical protein
MTRVSPNISPEKPVQLDEEALKKLDQGFSMAKKKIEAKKDVAGKKKKESERGKKDDTAGKEPDKKEGTTTAGETTGPAQPETPTDVVSAEVLDEMSTETSTEVMSEEAQELVQEEVQEVSAERLPDPPGPPSE